MSGPAARWRGPALPWEAALLLAPAAVDHVAVVGTGPQAEGWRRVATWWGLEPSSASELVLAASPADGAASGATTVLVPGADRQGVLAAAGYRTTTWRTRVAPGGAVLLVEGRHGLRPAVPAPRAARDRVRESAVRAVRRLGRPATLTVASHLSPVPALAAAVGDTRACVITGGGGPRRRPVLLTAPAAAARPSHAVKAGRSRDRDRGLFEQDVLARLHAAGLGGALPRPAGHGEAGVVAWTAESAVLGRPLADVLGERGSRQRVRRVLEDLTAWLGLLGTSTRSAAVSAEGLRAAGAAADRLAGVPGVLAHRDLAAGFNVLVDGTDWTVLDWETARDGAPPLLDVLPLLCGALTAGAATPGSRASEVLRLCAGEHPDSRWLLAQVGGYLHALDVPAAAAGTLAAMAFRHEVTLRLDHERLVQEAGDVVEPWESVWDHVVSGWPAHPELGAAWPALSPALRR